MLAAGGGAFARRRVGRLRRAVPHGTRFDGDALPDLLIETATRRRPPTERRRRLDDSAGRVAAARSSSVSRSDARRGHAVPSTTPPATRIVATLDASTTEGAPLMVHFDASARAPRTRRPVVPWDFGDGSGAGGVVVAAVAVAGPTPATRARC
jgi:hypothetical protein